MSRSHPSHEPDSPAAHGLGAEVRQLYHASLKPSDIAWNLYVARPLAALALVWLRRSPITPNQLSFAGLALFCAVPALFVLWPGRVGFAMAIVALEASYVLDCADGQLARLKQMTSAVGAWLDFLIDELKALLLVGGAAARLWLETHDAVWLLVGMIGVGLVATATALTTFVRRPEYAGQEIRPGTDVRGPAMPDGGLVRRAAWLVVRTLRLIVHYPSWLPFVALAGLLVAALEPTRLFLVTYLTVMTLYVGRVGLGVLLRLGSPRWYQQP